MVRLQNSVMNSLFSVVVIGVDAHSAIHDRYKTSKLSLADGMSIARNISDIE